MKRLFIIDDTLENKISYYHIAVFMAALPFDKLYSELALISFLLHILIHLTKQKLHSAFTVQHLLLSSVFIITAIGIIYSEDKSQGLKDLQRQLAVLLFPFLLAASGLNREKYKMRLLFIFSLICVCTILYLYADAIRIILYNKLPLSRLFTQAFINHNFSEPVSIHATYLSMYALLAAAVFLYVFIKSNSAANRIICLLSLLILLAGLLQLASRSVLISAIIVAISFPFLMPKGTKKLTFIPAIAGIAIFSVLVITNISSFKKRYVVQFRDDLTQTSINNELPEPRMLRWHYTLQLIAKSPLYGYGSGSEKRLLNEVYFNNKLYNSYLHELNAHNQYLSLLIKTGIWGLLVFLLTLITGVIVALRSKDILLLSFMIIICTVSFSENLLDVNKGIFFYAFFFSLFIHAGKPFGPLFRLKRSEESTEHPEPVNNTVHAAIVSSHNHV